MPPQPTYEVRPFRQPELRIAHTRIHLSECAIDPTSKNKNCATDVVNSLSLEEFPIKHWSQKEPKPSKRLPLDATVKLIKKHQRYLAPKALVPDLVKKICTIRQDFGIGKG
jgi:hypothetical protein